MLKWGLGLGLLAYTTLEIALLVEIGRQTGLAWTLAWTIGSAVAGVWLLRIQGIQGIVRIHQQLSQEVLPTRALIDMALIVAGGFLLVMPGIVSDVLGVLLLIPPVRWSVRTLILLSLEDHLPPEQGNGRPSREIIEVQAEHVHER